jgi:hypothetical protein
VLRREKQNREYDGKQHQTCIYFRNSGQIVVGRVVVMQMQRRIRQG